MKEVLSIDALYEEIKNRGCDLVVCNDAPLATALNNRVDTARLGIFAITPRQLAAKLAIECMGEPIINDVVLAKRVADDTGYSLKYVHGEITNFKAAARYTAEPRMGRKSRRIWNAYNGYNTIEKMMRRLGDEKTTLSEFYDGKKTAVVGLDLFDNLDKYMLPPDGDFEDVEIFTGGTYEVPEFRSLGNDRLIADCAADIARRCGPDNVAIVMDVGGPIADAIKSSLYRIGLPFINSLSVKDLGNIRNYLEFLHLALTYRTITVREVRELLRAYGGEIPSRYDKYNFSRFCETESITKSERIVRISEAMRDVGEMKFHEMAMFVPSGQRSSIIMLLDQMDCIEKNVTGDIVDDLFYAVNNIVALQHNEQIPAEEKSGVLLVDCKNSVFIDRPVVVYTGMCSEWEISLNNLDYIDPKKKPDIDMMNMFRFVSLIQQGTARFYFVNANKGGKKAVPCRYFDAALRPAQYSWEEDEDPSEPIEGFEQLGRVVEGPWRIDKKDRRGYRGDEEIDRADTVLSFSNSSYMKFMECPRRYLFSQLSGSPETDKTHTGNMIHAFAEFRTAYPELVEQNGLDYYVDEIVRQCAMLTSPDAEPIERSRIATEMKVVDEFIGRTGVTPSLRDDPDTDNYLVKMHGLTQTSENTEIKLVSREAEMNGKIDLFWDGVIYDFKTGHFKDIKDLTKEMDISDLRNGKVVRDHHKSCQPVFYLCLIADNDLKSNGRFDLLYAENRYNKLLAGGDADLDSCITSVELVDSVDDLVEKYAGDLLKGRRAEETIGYYNDLKNKLGNDLTVWMDADEDQLNSIAIDWGFMNIKRPTATGRKDVSDIIKAFVGCNSDLYPVDGIITVKKSFVERFRMELHEDMARLRGYYDTSFPCIPLVECEKCEFRDMCTGVVDIEGGEEVESE